MPILSPFISSRSDNISLYQLAGSTGSEGVLEGSSLTLNSTTSAQKIEQKFSANTFVFTQTPDPGVEQIIYSINQVSGDVSFGVNVTAPNQLTKRTAYDTTFFQNFPASAYPSNPAAGSIPFPAYTVTTTGIYLIQCNASFNVDPEAVVVGPSDFIQCGVGNFAPVTPVLSAINLKPWSMVGTASGQDYSVTGTFTTLLTAGDVVNLFYWVYDGSGTVSLGATSGGIQIKILPLC
jgi:hypothetical protein